MGAMVIGSITGSLFVSSFDRGIDQTTVIVQQEQNVPLRVSTASHLLGTWKGSWGYNAGDCALEITSVKGDEFSGTLRKEGAEIAIHGIFDPVSRAVEFRDIKVIRLGADMRQWSLGENRGSLSRDNRIMFGTGVDEWGQYAWAVSNR